MPSPAAHQLLVIEDCAQATGASWAGRPVGSWGDAGCFSFFPTKNLGAAGDGGAVTCRDRELAQRMRELAVHGMPRRYLHTDLGYNSRLDALQAAVLGVKLPHLDRWVKRRRAIAARYQRELAELQRVDPAGARTRGPQLEPVRGARHALPCRHQCLLPQLHAPRPTAAEFGLPEAACRDWHKQQLQGAGVHTIIYYPIPIHRQPAYTELDYRPGSLPITERLCSEVLSLPIFPELNDEQQDTVIAALRDLLNKQRSESAQSALIANMKV